MDETAWNRLVARLKPHADRRVLLAGLAGASLLGSAAALPDGAGAHCHQFDHVRTRCPDIKPTDNLQAAINAADSGSTRTLCPGTFHITTTLMIENDLTLTGAGDGQTILDGEDSARVLVVGFNRTVTVELLIITRGFAGGNERGGGIANSGHRTLRRMTVSHGEAHKGGGIALFPDSTLIMHVNSIVEQNTARNDGGGIINDGAITMNEGRFVRNNSAPSGAGGGIMSQVGTVTMNGGSFVLENSASTSLLGGGIFADEGNVTLNDGSTIAGNSPDDCEPAQGTCT